MADSERFRRFAMAYRAESPHAKEVLFVVKQHPRESGEQRAAWQDTAARMPDTVEVSEADTYLEMGRCDVQLTGQSSTLYEAIHFGLSTYAIPDPTFAVDRSRLWPREGVRTIGFDYRGPFEPIPLTDAARALARSMWGTFDAEAFRRHVGWMAG